MASEQKASTQVPEQSEAEPSRVSEQEKAQQQQLPPQQQQQQQTPGIEENNAQKTNPFQIQEEAMAFCPQQCQFRNVAKDAAKEAFVAQQEAQEVIEQAYAKQLKAQEKARGAAQQLLAQQESEKEEATLAASQAAVEEQKVAAQKQFDQAAIAGQFLGAQIAQQAMASAQASANPGLSQGNLAPVVPFNQQPGGTLPNRHLEAFLQSSYEEQEVTCMQVQPAATAAVAVATVGVIAEQQELLGWANQMASSAAYQMSLAQSVASSTQDHRALLAAKTQADAAQNQMAEAQKIAQAAQSPATALQAVASIRQSSQQSGQPNQQQPSVGGAQSTEPMQMG
eukprot:Gb_19431 [translate_table: standard]